MLASGNRLARPPSGFVALDTYLSTAADQNQRKKKETLSHVIPTARPRPQILLFSLVRAHTSAKCNGLRAITCQAQKHGQNTLPHPLSTFRSLPLPRGPLSQQPQARTPQTAPLAPSASSPTEVIGSLGDYPRRIRRPPPMLRGPKTSTPRTSSPEAK